MAYAAAEAPTSNVLTSSAPSNTRALNPKQFMGEMNDFLGTSNNWELRARSNNMMWEAIQPGGQTKHIVRFDVDNFAHPIPGSGGSPVPHMNFEVQKLLPNGRWSSVSSDHIVSDFTQLNLLFRP
jgi:hypothetical protein